MYSQINMDGIWLDRNEAYNECDGECDNDLTHTLNSNFSIPYNPLSDTENLETHSISVDAMHYGETDEDKEVNIEYNMHSIYGFLQSKHAYQFWQDDSRVSGNRPFIMSRSTFAGSGKYAGHWLGDNQPTWDDMRLSISGIFDFNLFGIPLVGADVCGSRGVAQDDLCARWMQLSVFYPFARNSYSRDANSTIKGHEAYNLAAPYNETAKNAIEQRYSFLRYFYTLMYEVSQNKRGMMVQPLYFEFPDDENTYSNFEQSFMVGSALKVSPVLTQDDSDSLHTRSYFPEGRRFISLNDFKTIHEGTGKNDTLNASWNYTLVHMKEGTIIPYQNTKEKYFSTTMNLITDDGLDLLIFPDKNGYAEGTVYIDSDGTSQTDIEGKVIFYVLRCQKYLI